MIKKIVSLFLMICMLLSLAVAVSAEGVTTVYLQIEENPNALGQIFVYVAVKDNVVVVDTDGDGQIGDAEKGGLAAYQLFVDYDQEKFTLVNILQEGQYEGGFTANKKNSAVVWTQAGGLYSSVIDNETYETKVTGISDAKIVRYVFNANKNAVTEADYGKAFKFEFGTKSNATITSSSGSYYGYIDFSPVSYIMPDFRPDMEGLSFEDKNALYSGEVIDAPVVEGAPENATVTYEIKKDGAVVSEIKNAGSYTVTANVIAEGYKPATLTATVNVEKKPITVTINDAAMFYGEDIPEFTTDAPEGVQLVFDEFGDLTAGKHNINATATSENYEVTVISGTLTVYKPEIYATVSQGNNPSQLFVDVLVKDNIPSIDADNNGVISEKEANGLSAYQLVMDYNSDVFKLVNITAGEKYDGTMTVNVAKGIAVWANAGGLTKSETDEEYNTTVAGFENAHLLRYVFTVNMDNITEADYGKQFDFALTEESNASFIDGKAFVNTEDISYELPKLSYTYKFEDEDGTVIAQKTAKYGSEIELPENPVKESTVQYSYSFDKWVGYTEGMKLTQDVTFTASYKAELNKYTYKFLNEDGSIFSQETADYGTKINLPKVNPEKESTAVYTYAFEKWVGYTEEMTVTGDVEFVATFKENYIPYVEITGETAIERGEKLVQKVTFVSPEAVNQIVCQLVYPEEFTAIEITPKDFKNAVKDELVTKDGFNYLTVVCTYEEGKTLAPNTIVSPFEVAFDVSKTADAKKVEIKFGNDTYLKGEEDYTFEIIRNTEINILPKLAEELEISGEDKIYKASSYVATVLPDYTSNKEIIWSVDDEAKATISQEGVLTPIKNGIVTIKAETKDGSGVYGTKTVEVFKECSVNNIVIENGLWNTEFNSDVKEYTVYVSADTTSINLKAEYEGGELKCNGETIENNKVKEIAISQDEVIIALERICTDYLNRTYTIKLIRTPKETKAEVKENEDKKEIEIVLPLEKLVKREVYMVITYTNDNGKVEVEGKLVNNDTNKFTVEVEESKAVEKCKVLFWESLTNLKPVYNSAEKEF